MSNMYEKVKYYFLLKLWDETRVHNAVVKGWITAEEFKKITSCDFK